MPETPACWCTGFKINAMQPTAALMKYLTNTQRETVVRLQAGEVILITDRYIRDVCKALIKKGAAIYKPGSQQCREVVIAPGWETVDVSIKRKGPLYPGMTAHPQDEKADPFRSKIPRPPAVYSNLNQEQHINRILNPNYGK
jgi:hypothetical protein